MEQNGQQNTRRTSRMMFILLVSAVFCALATYTAINLVARRSVATDSLDQIQRRQVIINDFLITLNPDPNKVVSLPHEFDEATATLADNQNPQLNPSVNTAPAIAPEPSPSPVPPSPTPIPPKVHFITYIVQTGDSLYSIADKQNSSIELMALHGIDDDDLDPGAALNLPIANPAFCHERRAYVVRDHDTVFSISRAFNTSPEAIRLLNGLNTEYLIETADVICIPVE